MDLDGELEEDSKGDFRGDFKQDIEGDLLSSSGQVRSRSGLVQVWFSLQPKFYSFELDSEVGRLVLSCFECIIKKIFDCPNVGLNPVCAV